VATIPNGCPPGKSTYTLFCSVCVVLLNPILGSLCFKTHASGTFLLETSEVRSTHLLLQTNYRKTNKGPSSPSPLLVRVPHDPLALDVRISQSNRSKLYTDDCRHHTDHFSVELGKPQSLMVVLSTGRNNLDKISIKLTSPSITFYTRDTVLLAGICLQICSFPKLTQF
jgi:hypothetical protein